MIPLKKPLEMSVEDEKFEIQSPRIYAVALKALICVQLCQINRANGNSLGFQEETRSQKWKYPNFLKYSNFLAYWQANGCQHDNMFGRLIPKMTPKVS